MIYEPICTKTQFGFQHVQGNANKAADALSRIPHTSEITPKQICSHFCWGKENEQTVKIREVDSKTEFGNQSTSLSNDKSLPERRGKLNQENQQEDIKNAQVSDRKYKVIIDALLWGNKLTQDKIGIFTMMNYYISWQKWMDKIYHVWKYLQV